MSPPKGGDVRRLPLLRGGSRACAGGEDGKTNALISCTRQGTIFTTKKR